jgi:hypothetical protein
MSEQIVTEKEQRRHNRRLAKVAVSFSADSFVVNQSLVLRINICSKNRHLRQAPNRQAVKKLRFSLNYIKIYRCIIQYRHPKQACFLSSNF